MCVGCITSQEDALVQSVVGSDALANLVHREPVDVAELKLIGLEDLLCSVDADVLGLLAAVCTGL